LEPEAAGRRLDAGRHGGRAVAELRLDPLGLGVEPAASGDLRARERRTRADDHGVGGRAGAEHVERLRSGEPEPAALAGREPPEAVVATELAPVLRHDRTRLRREPVPAEKRPVVVAGEEARLLALRPPGGSEARALRLGPGRL